MASQVNVYVKLKLTGITQTPSGVYTLTFTVETEPEIPAANNLVQPRENAPLVKGTATGFCTFQTNNAERVALLQLGQTYWLTMSDEPPLDVPTDPGPPIHVPPGHTREEDLPPPPPPQPNASRRRHR